MRKKILSAAIAGMLIMTLAVPVSATPSQDEAAKNFRQAQEKVEELTGQIRQLNGKIETLLQKIDDNKKQMQDVKDEMDNTKKEIETSKEEIEKQEGILGKRVRELYKSGGQTSYLSILFSAESFSDLISKIDFTGRLINLDKKVVNELQDEQEKLDKKVSELEKKNKELVEINEQTQKTVDEFTTQRSEQETIIAEAKEVEKQLDAELYDIEIANAIAYFDVIDSSTSIEEIKSAVNNLTSLLGQVISPRAQEKINEYIAYGNSEVSRLTAELEANRGDESVPGLPGNTGNAIVDYAMRFLGVPYVYGGSTPAGFDCSGLTSYVYRAVAGKEIGRTTYVQANAGTTISYSQLQPGDLVFTYGLDHVGIYVGGGSYIHAPQPGQSVKISAITSFTKGVRVL